MRNRHFKAKPCVSLFCSTALIICLAVLAAGQASDDRTRTGPMFKSTDGGASWTAINTGILAQSVFALAIDPTSPQTIYAGSDRGIFKSTDGGASWIVPNTDVSFFTITDIAIDPVTASTLYAATSGGGAYKSTDGGASWSRINNGLFFNKILGTLAINPATPSILYLGGEEVIYKSINGGGNWESVLSLPFNEIPMLADLKLDARDPATVYAVGKFKVFKSTDGGSKWNDITGQLVTPFGITLDPVNSSTLYVRTAFDSGLFKSTNGGSNWSAVELTTPTLGRISPFELAIDPVSSLTLYSGGPQGVFKSTDGGASWAETGLSINNGLTSAVRSLAINPLNPQTIYAGGDGGPSANDSPWIRNIFVEAKRLVVNGDNFDDGAVILLDGEPQKTSNDPQNPTRMLIGKKAGKKVKKHPQTRIQIMNANGKLSQSVVRPVD